MSSHQDPSCAREVASPPSRGRLRRFARFLLRWTWRGIVFIALFNLCWDLWSWRDRTFAEGERRFFRASEQTDDIDYGTAQVVLVNETDREFLIDSFVLDGWGGPYTHKPASARTLARVGEAGSTRTERRYLDHLLGTGDLFLQEGVDGPIRRVTFQVDRRRPVSCRVEVRIQDDREVVSGCEFLPVIRTEFRWLFGPPDYD